MLTCDVEVTHDPAMAILQPLRQVGNHVVAFAQTAVFPSDLQAGTPYLGREDQVRLLLLLCLL